MMDKTFDPGAVEARVARAWDEAEAFKAGRADRAGAEPYCIVIPPPNVTGSLHMGHALNNTLQDVLCRFERMRGRDVLWQVGTDHAGIATQMVVERRLMERQEPDRRALGREAFLERVWAWKAESGGAIVNQLKRLGASCDWSRERFTMDEGLSAAVVKVFVDLHTKGLVYRDKRLVNWDPRFQTAISDLEVQQVEVKGHLWHFAYPIVDEAGKATGERIVVATTRPETMLGDTAVAVHPDDERYRHLVGRRARLPLVGRLIPIVADAYSDPEKGTGAVKITPAHDFNDFEVGRRHGLETRNILDAEGRIISGPLANKGELRYPVEGHPTLVQRDPAGSNDLGQFEAIPPELRGLDRFEARKRVVEMIDALGLLVAIEPHTHVVPHGDRSGVVVEPYLTDQWYVDVKPLAERALAAVRDGRTRIVPETWEKTYFQWLEGIEPWCVSRQLWWGHQIPVWYGPDGHPYVAESEAAARALARARHGGEVTLRRDEDVLDTWFSSALWPFSTLGWPEATPELARYYPTDALVTGFDIIFFWVARMMMMGLHCLDEVPFRTVYIHALVRDGRGAKMSKSKGNVIDPLDLVDQYGADALRFTLAAMAAQGRDIKLSLARVEGYRNFATKLWNAARFAEMNGCRIAPGFDPRAATATLNRWALGEAARAVDEAAAGIQAYRFNDAAGAAYRFVWNVFCDWYLELAKPVLQGEDGPAKDEARATVAYLLDAICRLLHPFMPFLTEELWAIKGAEAGLARGVLALAPWPDLAGLADPAAEAELGWVVDLVGEVRSARSETSVPPAAKVPLVLVRASAEARERLGRWEDALCRLARLSGVTVADAAPPSSVQLLVRGEVAAMPLEGIVDLAAEVVRLGKETAREEGEIARVDAKLGNADFLARAPEEVVEEQRERREAAASRLIKLKDALARLGPTA